MNTRHTDVEQGERASADDYGRAFTSRHPWLLLAFVSLTVALAFQGARGLRETTEGRYSLVALEMLRSGDWLVPTRAGIPHLTKPPFTYWGIAAGTALLGTNGWGARIAIGIAFAAAAFAVAGIGWRMGGRRCGVTAGLVYATSPYPAAVSNTVNTDTFLALWMILAVFAYWSMRSGRHSRAWNALMWFCVGMGFFTKGPPALLAASPIILFHLLCPPAGIRRSVIFNPTGLMVFFVTAFWYYTYIVLLKPDMLNYYIEVEIVRRIRDPAFGHNTEWWKPFTMYLPVVLVGGGIWSWWCWRRSARARLWSPRQWRRAAQTSNPDFFLALWLALPLLVFSLVSSRLYTYLMPIFPALSLLAARELNRHRGQGALSRPALATLGLSLALVVGGKAIAAYAEIAPKRDMERAYHFVSALNAPENAVYYWYNEGRGLGLGYYLDRTPVWLTSGRTAGDVHDEFVPRQNIDEFLRARLRSETPPSPGVMLTLLAHQHEIESRLSRYGLRFSRSITNDIWFAGVME